MFLENPVTHNEQFGWIEVICGSMFSGKTEELIRRLKRAQFAKQKIEIFKPAIDKRYDDQMVTSHDSNQIPSTSVPAAANIPILANDCQVVGIDEAQFFDDEIVQVKYTKSEDNTLDICTKNLPANLFKKHSSKLITDVGFIVTYDTTKFPRKKILRWYARSNRFTRWRMLPGYIMQRVI